jgi:hypothetical protein
VEKAKNKVVAGGKIREEAAAFARNVAPVADVVQNATVDINARVIVI